MPKCYATKIHGWNLCTLKNIPPVIFFLDVDWYPDSRIYELLTAFARIWVEKRARFLSGRCEGRGRTSRSGHTATHRDVGLSWLIAASSGVGSCPPLPPPRPWARWVACPRFLRVGGGGSETQGVAKESGGAAHTGCQMSEWSCVPTHRRSTTVCRGGCEFRSWLYEAEKKSQNVSLRKFIPEIFVCWKISRPCYIFWRLMITWPHARPERLPRRPHHPCCRGLLFFFFFQEIPGKS